MERENLGGKKQGQNDSWKPSSQLATTDFLEPSHDPRSLWCTHLKAYKVTMEAVDRQLKKQSVMTLADYEVVEAINIAGGLLRFVDLAGITLLSQSRISRQIGALEAKGILTREINATDRRAAHVSITEAGKVELEKSAKATVEALRANFYDHFPYNEYETLQQALDCLLEPDYHAAQADLINTARLVNGLAPLISDVERGG